jgi:glycosyltransferase involved in cell wall biosynthesis
MNKILAISNHAHMLGGGEYSFLDLVSRLHAPWDVLAVIPGEGQLKMKLEDNKIRTRIIPLPSIKPWSIHRILRSLNDLVVLGVAQRLTLIYANGSRAAFYGGIAGRFLNIPVIWHCRIVDPDPLMDYILCRLSSLMIVNSLAAAKRFKLRFQSKTRVVYNAVDLARFKEFPLAIPAILEDPWKVILVVARLSRDKRHDILLSAFERLAELYPDLHLVCLGGIDPLDWSWSKELQKRSNRPPYSEKVHWIGHVEDVRPWYRRAQLLALASEKESFGRVLVEAMVCGLPVVATRSGGVPEIVRNEQDGILVTPGSVNEMADAIKRLLTDKTLATRLSEAGRLRAEEFTIENHVTHMVRVFEETIRNRLR